MPTEYTPFIGKDILKQLMFSMYSDSLTIYREYVQNASDSIYSSVKQGLFTQTKDGYVEIKICPTDRSIVIADNAAGIQRAKATSTLLDVSNSNKDGIEQAGLYGIGRLVGAGFCHRLVFETSAQGEDKGTKLSLNVDLAEELINNNEKLSASDVLKQISTETEYPEESNKHYFRVTLYDVKEDYPELLDQDAVTNYLNSVAPVEYTDTFKANLIHGKNNPQPEFIPRHEALREVQITVNGTRIQKQYGLSIVGTGDKINNLEYFKIECPKYGELAWGWYALTKFTIQIPTSDELQGIRLRKHNIQIGGMTQLSSRNYWSEERGNYYFYGEVHITNQNISPNGARDGLVPSPEARKLETVLTSTFREITKNYKKANEAKNAIKNAREGIEEAQKRGFINAEIKDKIENKGIDKFKRIESSFTDGSVHRMLGLYRPDMKDIETEYENMKPKQTTPAVPAPETELSTPATPASVSEPSTPVAPTPGTELPTLATPTSVSEPSATTDYTLEPKTFTPTALEPPTTETATQPTIGSKELLKDIEKVLDKKEMFFIRNIFRIISECPLNEHDRKVADALKIYIAKELTKISK